MRFLHAQIWVERNKCWLTARRRWICLQSFRSKFLWFPWISLWFRAVIELPTVTISLSMTLAGDNRCSYLEWNKIRRRMLITVPLSSSASFALQVKTKWLKGSINISNLACGSKLMEFSEISSLDWGEKDQEVVHNYLHVWKWKLWKCLNPEHRPSTTTRKV